METSRSPAQLLVGAALIAPAAVCALLSQLRGDVPSTDAALVLVLVVVAVAAGGSRVAGVVAALSCAAWFDFFLTEPYYRFTIADRDDIETAVLLTLVGIGVTEIALWGRRQQARASAQQGYLSGVVDAASMVATGEASTRVVLDFVARQIAELLGVDRCVYAAGPPGGAHPLLTRDGTVTRDGRPLDVDRSGLPTNDVTELSVQRGGTVLGRFVLTSVSHTAYPSLDQRRVAVTLADQAAAVLGTADPHLR